MKTFLFLAFCLSFFAHAVFAVDPNSELTDLKTEYRGEKTPDGRFHIQEKMARLYASMPLTPSLAKEAESLAVSLLKEASKRPKDWDMGNAIHHGNLVLGRVKLLHKDIAGAKRHLSLAGQTPGSPQLNSFGPNMTLARELLLKGERAAVLKYFEDCTKFWKSESAPGKISAWKASIAKNRAPNFGPHLLF